jgi:myotubularin-related protein 1/2
VVIYDARSWIAAKGNMLTGKGTENLSYYKNCELVFLDIENIHKVRESYK